MTDYDPKPTAYHQQERIDDEKSGMGWLGWLIGLLVLGAIVWFLFFFFDVDQTQEGNLELPNVEISGGDIDLPKFDVDAGEIDVDLPTVDVDVSGGDIDVRGAAEGAEADDISGVDGTVNADSQPGLQPEDVDVPDVDVDVDVDVDEPQ